MSSGPAGIGIGGRALTVMITGLALFAMYFGAGNLILPVMIGIEGGTAAGAVTGGFVLTGVLLPVLAMVAAATSEQGIEGIAYRIGRYPGLVYCWIAFLSTGMLYAIPRVATVSFGMSVGAIGNLPGDPGSPALLIYTAVFLVVAALLAANPTNLISKVGSWLTPALLILMLVLIVGALTQLTPVLDAPAEKYTAAPFVSGLLTGYNTLDAIASLVFGGIVIDSLRSHGFTHGAPLFRTTVLAGLLAGALLALIYFGLGSVGTRIGDAEVSDGAAGLAHAAWLLFGAPGQWLLGLIAILACLTTSVGLFGASVTFFNKHFPRVGRTRLLIIHVAVAFAVANLGLATLMNLVVPLMYFCYPVTIAIVAVAIADIFIPGHLFWSYRFTAWASAVFGLIDAILQGYSLFAVTPPDWFTALIKAIPFADLSLGWVVPALLGFTIGMICDGATGRFAKHLDMRQTVDQELA